MATVSRPVFEVSGLNFIQVLNNAPDEVKPWAHFIKIETELAIYGFTSFDRVVVINGDPYYPNTSISPSSVKKSSAIESSNLDIKGLIASDMLSDLDLRAGKFNDARVTVFIGDFLAGTVIKTLAVGKWGQVRKTDQIWEVTIRTNADILQQSVFQSLSRTCRWSKRLEDVRCGVNIDQYTTYGAVAEYPHNGDSSQFIMGAVANFPGFGDNVSLYNWTNGSGYVKVLSGLNAGYKLPINFVYDPGTGGVGVRLLNIPPYVFGVGDSIQLIPGCDGSMIMCRYRFNNTANFGGISDGAHFFPTKEKLRQ